ncbi:MAG: CBS domain-containing protein [Acidobacteria bacterium]|nr:CBS domain-containing protein [Acidobacteriota bacterium]
MKVKEIMTHQPVYGTPDTSIHVIAQLMAENDCGCIPIVASEEVHYPIGVVTDRDIVLRTVALNNNPLNYKAADIMTNTIFTTTPETALEECCRLMETHQIRRLAVVDPNGALCGMISQADIATHAPPEKTAEVVQVVSKTAER